MMRREDNREVMQARCAVQVPDKQMNLLHVRRAVNLRLVGWPLSKAKFSPQPDKPFNGWDHEVHSSRTMSATRKVERHACVALLPRESCQVVTSTPEREPRRVRIQ
jgi:hypothetical protein